MSEQAVTLLTLTAQGLIDTLTPDIETLTLPNQQGGAAARKARFTVDVTAISGAGATLACALYTRIDGVVTELHSFTNLTAIGQESVVLDVVPKDVFLAYAVTGTGPSITGTVTSLRI